jgi:hypothetical protein
MNSAGLLVICVVAAILFVVAFGGIGRDARRRR